MEFRLVYRGSLPSASNSNSRSKEKHDIRKQLHWQLKQFWESHHQLRHYLVDRPLGTPVNLIAALAKKFKRGVHGFAPLVRRDEDIFCSLNILFLRRDIPGKIVHGKGGGDLDNRLKTLLDAMQLPNENSGLPDSIEAGYDPIFCLLEDDDQITSIQVTTDRILTPLETAENINDVLLVIHVHIYRGTNVTQVIGLPGQV